VETWSPSSPATVATWLIPFALIVYLGMKRGGFEQPVRGEVGVAVWWAVCLGLLAAQLPARRVGRAGWIGLGLLVAFAGWTALGVSWSDSAGKSMIEVARVVVYVGVLALALLIGGRDRIRIVIGAVAAGCAVISLVALLSRLHPAWFPDDDLSQLLVGVQSRLRYPVGYWNALAGLVAIGLPLMLWAATSARATLLRALAAGAVPAMALTIYFTYSRTGVAVAAVALLALLALSERRLALLPTLGIVGAISGLVVWQASRRQALVDALGDSTAIAQGDEMLFVVGVGSLICAALVWALSKSEAWGWLPRIPAVPKRTALAIGGAVLVVALAAFAGIGGPTRVADGFEQFKAPAGLSDSDERLQSVAGNGRWQYWSSAVDAAGTDVVRGIGPGTFQFWWSENGESSGLIRDAHSLFVETLGELGVIGLILIAAFVLLILGLGATRALRAAGERRNELAALTAAALVFTIAAGADWLWELAVVPVAFMFVAAAILTASPPRTEIRGEAQLISPHGATGPVPSRLRRSAPALGRVAGALLAAGAIVVIAIPTLTAERLSESQSDFAAGDYAGALERAESAEDLEPFAAAPHVQQAFALEATEQYAKAATAARLAVDREPDNWENWYLLSRIQAARGDKRGAALIALRRAQELNPLSLLLNPIRCGAQGRLCAGAPAPG